MRLEGLLLRLTRFDRNIASQFPIKTTKTCLWACFNGAVHRHLTRFSKEFASQILTKTTGNMPLGIFPTQQAFQTLPANQLKYSKQTYLYKYEEWTCLEYLSWRGVVRFGEIQDLCHYSTNRVAGAGRQKI